MTQQITTKRVYTKRKEMKKRLFHKVNCCVCGLEYEVIHKTNTSKCWDCIQKHQRYTAGIGRKNIYDLGGYD